MQKSALYRKHRPLTFSDVVGQEHITNTLRRQVMNGAVSHAYLFTGTRGTGKTTCAKILSRAINCLNPKDGEPCNECAVCKGILDGSIFDVSEIDAASNNGVDDIRTLRDDIVYTPISTRYKVYIIDEVHMLSASAFNALLKTLEEPPEHAVFILATTDPHKVPATILSRCQRFDFFRVGIQTLKERIQEILRRENITLDPNSVSLVASLADGSVRDALSILDKVIEMDTPEQIEQVLGVIGKKTLWSIAEAVADGDTDAIYAKIAELYSSSKDMGILHDELTRLFRNMLVVRSASDPSKFIDAGEEELENIKRLSALFEEKQLVFALKTLRESRQALAKSTDTRADTELCLITIADPSLNESTEALAARIEVLERAVKNGIKVRVDAAPAAQPEKPKEKPVSVSAAPEKPAKEPETQPVSEPKPAAEPPKAPETKKEPEKETPSDGQWRELESLKDIAAKVTDMATRMTLSDYCRAVYKGNDVIILAQSADDAKTLKTHMDKIVQAFESDRKFNRNISVTAGEPITKYVTASGDDPIENNPMFRME